ncbi:hypothetical protein F4679DRAFT_163736 [Xylaria curta]|nr:hypothetical protein F4679DRAFT_163736 [Xylaria curta]
MKVCGLAVFSTLALSACLSRSVNDAEAVTAVGQGDAANVGAEVQAGVIGNNSAVANGSNGDNQNENQDNQNEGEENNVENGNENLDGVLNGKLEDSFNDISIDPNDIQGSLGQNILDLLLAMGICNFNLNSLQGLSLGNEIQLLLQLQQLQQLQALGIVNSFAVDQLIQREILSRTFNLDIIRRSIDASVKQASRGRKRTTILRRQCANVGQGNANNGAGQVDQDQAEQDQVNQDQANQEQANQEQANQEQANQGQENQDQGKDEAEEEGNEVNKGEADEKDEIKDSEEGVEVE